MAHEEPIPLLESAISDLQLDTTFAYRDYLIDAVLPHEQVHDAKNIGCSGPGLYSAMAAKLLQRAADPQKAGRITSPNIRWRNEVLISHSDVFQAVREHQQAERVASRADIPLRDIMRDNSGYLVCAATAIRGQVDLQEVFRPFSHIDETAMAYARRMFDCGQKLGGRDSDLFYSLVVHTYLNDYATQSWQSHISQYVSEYGQTSSEADEDDLAAAFLLDHRYEGWQTYEVSQLAFTHMERRTVEDLVSSGYGPLAPEKYAALVRQIIGL